MTKPNTAAATALTTKQLAELLTKAGGKLITEQHIRDDVARGAPRNGDGTMHLIHYTAWLAGQVE
ncbi:MAG: hypothetical protein K8U03_09290 [Planctomycetia bacterium]|nr:hypothetical protein [Planctomycetia bacterium]